MPTKDKVKQYQSIKAMFENGSAKRMRDIEKLFPTMVAKDLGMNHSRYINKLYKPELFSFKQIMKFGAILNLNPAIISEVIVNELLTGAKSKKK